MLTINSNLKQMQIGKLRTRTIMSSIARFDLENMLVNRSDNVTAYL